MIIKIDHVTRSENGYPKGWWGRCACGAVYGPTDAGSVQTWRKRHEELFASQPAPPDTPETAK